MQLRGMRPVVRAEGHLAMHVMRHVHEFCLRWMLQVGSG